MGNIDPATLEPGHIVDDWDARSYLDYYYGSHKVVPDDEAHMFRFLARGLRDVGIHFDTGLELGCGPVLHHAAQVVPWVERLDMADVQDANLEEIRKWLRRDPGAFDWSTYIGGARGALDAEDGRGGTLADREALMRSRIAVRTCDLRDATPLGAAIEYPLVVSYYCTEWVIPSIEGWRATMRNVTSLIAHGGWLFLAGVHASTFCVINGRRMPCATITTDELHRMFGELGFDPATVRLDVTPGLAPSESGIQGTFMVYGQRR